ncbi:MAG: hypothetical protein ACTSPK_00090 [Candidatus Heimdallarchaeota archaeon]
MAFRNQTGRPEKQKEPEKPQIKESDKTLEQRVEKIEKTIHHNYCFNEGRIRECEKILDTTNGYKPVKTIKALAKGTIMGTVNLAEQLALWKHEIDKKFNIICDKLKNIEEKGEENGRINNSLIGRVKRTLA